MTELQATLEVQRTLVLILDLCGTFAFALSGAMAGIRRRLDVFGLLAEIPVVLRSDLYAVAALAGAAIVAGGHVLHVPALVTAVCGGLVCFGLRILALRRGWQLPRPPA